MDYGAVIERGKVISAGEKGYTVASLDRPGIEAPEIKAIDGGTYTVGNAVYFFLFPDGTGRIICGESAEV